MVVRDLGKGDAKPTIIYINRDTKIKKRVLRYLLNTSGNKTTCHVRMKLKLLNIINAPRNH